jgi:hypothetical protein
MGVLALERRTPPQGAALRAWLTGVREAFASRILSFTDITATVCAALHVPNPRSERDAMIAATALEHGFTVVTRNEPDFVGTGAALVNPWTVDLWQLFHRHTLRQIPRLVHIRPPRASRVIRQQLQRHHVQHRA